MPLAQGQEEVAEEGLVLGVRQQGGKFEDRMRKLNILNLLRNQGFLSTFDFLAFE